MAVLTWALLVLFSVMRCQGLGVLPALVVLLDVLPRCTTTGGN